MRSYFAINPALAISRVLAAPRLPPVVATLRVWRQRARERAELAGMDAAERRDLPFGRDVDIQVEVRKPFWRA